MIVDRAYSPCRAASALKAMLDGLSKFGSTPGGGFAAGELSIFSRISGGRGARAIMVMSTENLVLHRSLNWRCLTANQTKRNNIKKVLMNSRFWARLVFCMLLTGVAICENVGHGGRTRKRGCEAIPACCLDAILQDVSDSVT